MSEHTIQLDRADFFELKSLILQAELAKQAAQAKMTVLVQAKGGDPKRLYGLDDATCSLIPAGK